MSPQPTERPLRMAEDVVAGSRGSRVARWALQRLLSRVTIGQLTVLTPDGDRLVSPQSAPGPQATVALKSWRAMRRIVLDGDIGLAEAYRDGEIQTPDLTALIELGARNDATLRALVSGIWPLRVFNRMRHLLNANSRAGSRRNITAHYDLGNDFYRLWLDASMMYSSALYTSAHDTLEVAQQRRLDRIVAMLDLSGGEHVLEIGCGWGALAERLAREGCHVTAITLSPAQLEATRQRIEGAGLSDRVTVQLQDYRDVTGLFDRVVSIEMIEAVGRDYWPAYFATLRRSLRHGGRAVLQAITIDEARFDDYQRGTDFIQRYIFPGGCLPSVSAIGREGEAAGLAVAERFSFGDSYALTLREWRRRFEQRWSEISALGFDESFRRLWEFYLCYCEAGFRSRAIDVSLMALEPAQPVS